MRRILVGALAGLLLLACGGDDVGDPFANAPGGSSGRPNDASTDRRDGPGGSGVGGAGGRATGGSAGVGGTSGGAGGGAMGGAAGSAQGDADVEGASGAGGGAGDGGPAGVGGGAGSSGAAGGSGAAGSSGGGAGGGGAGSGGAGGVEAGATGGSDVDAGSGDASPDVSVDAAGDVSLGNDSGADAADGAPSGDEPQCSLANQCPAPANECLVATCVDGGCGSAPVAAGTPIASQVAGNCKRTVCNGAGGTQDQNDNNDVPNDSNACTSDGCNAGTPTFVPLTGQMCGTSGVCSAAGQCVGCNAPADCPGTNDFCKTKTCAGNMCGWSYTGAGVPLPDGQQTAGDCKRRICTADGNVTTEALPADLPVDQSACTQDLCTGPTPSNPFEAAGFACGGGHVCDGAGACVECIAPGHCGNPGGYPCVVATCSGDHHCGTANAGPGTACGAAASCGSGTQHLADQCGGGQCVPGADSACSPYACGATSCKTSCDAPGDCAGGFSCDTVTHYCVPPGCITYCDVIQANCTGTNQEFPGRGECIKTCANAPADLLQCRTDHAGFAHDDPVTHCPHAGPGGASTCGFNCPSFCAIAASACPGESFAGGCETACTAFAGYTDAYTTATVTGNTFACRLYHLTLASVDPVGHCPHIRVISDVCGP